MLKKITTLVTFCLLVVPKLSLAYLPPSHFIAQKIVDERTAFNRAILQISILLPKENIKATEKLLWETKVTYDHSFQGAWPTTTLLLENSAEKIIQSWRSFELPAPAEADLVLYKKEDYENEKEIPSPFYKRDPSISLKRYKNRYAWVASSDTKEKSLWIEKESFIPLAMMGPCPKNINDVSSVSISDSSKCELQFDRSLFSKNSASRVGKIILRHEEKPILIFKIEHLFLSPKEVVWKAAIKENLETTPSPKELKSIIEQLFY